MLTKERESAIIKILLQKKKDLTRELGRLVLEGDIVGEGAALSMWVLRTDERTLHEKQVNLEGFEDVYITVTFVKPNFFEDVLAGNVDVPFWQVATVFRVLKNCKPIYDPEELITNFISLSDRIKWTPEIIRAKKGTVGELIEKALYWLGEEMLADAFFWLIKATEEALCIPLMQKQLFNLGTPTLIIDTLSHIDKPELYELYLEVLGMNHFTVDDVWMAMKELERLADHLYQKDPKSPRAQRILTGFVSINETERLLKRIEAIVGDVSEDGLTHFLNASVAELWQAYFLIALTPRGFVPLDPWVVGLFWKWFVREASEEDIKQLAKRIMKVAGL